MNVFSYKVVEQVAVITMDHEGEPVNTLFPEISESFEKELEKAKADDEVLGVVFISGKKDSFVAGAKIEMLESVQTQADGEEISKHGQEAFARLEAFPKPLVAAIHGACLGGGYEWVLACTHRIATDHPKTVVGLPEVQLGLLPGAGGTQRLARLIGARAAMDIILAGKSVKAKKAKTLGMVDEVVPVPILEEVAIRRAKELARKKPEKGSSAGSWGNFSFAQKPAKFFQNLANTDALQELALEENPIGRKLLFDQAKKQLLKKTKGKYPAPEKALEAIRIGVEEGMERGLAAERRLFGELCVSDVSKHLIQIFHATTALKKETGTTQSAKAEKVKKVGVLGGGLMGGGIAFVTADKLGLPVRIKDKDDEGCGRAQKHVYGLFDQRVKRRSLTTQEAAAKKALVTTTTDYSGFKGADIVIEAVFEDLALKHRILKEVEEICSEKTIFATNTSSLPITDIAKGASRPENVIGMHYFSPVNKMPLLEIITHKGTADWVTATAVKLGKGQGKTVIVVNDGVGFYTSRILAPYMNEAAYLLVEGADIAQLDKALTDFGFPVGPVTLLDEVGIDVAEKVAKIMFEAFGKRMEAPETLKKVTADGRLGRKTKKGFYTYSGKEKSVDSSVYQLLPGGKNRAQLDASEMAERCVLVFVNEAIRCLEENVLRSARDGDIGAIFGLGFPPFLGGPFRYVDEKGADKILARLQHYERKYGARFSPSPLLVKMARDNKPFHA